MRLDTPKLTLGLRIAQAIFATIVLGLTGYVASWWSSYWHAAAPAQISFLLFTAIWTLLVLLSLTLLTTRFAQTRLANANKILLGVEALTMLFWFAGFVALAVFLSDRVCFGSVCASAKAAAGVGGFVWLFFAITTTLATLGVFRGGSRSAGGIGRGAKNVNTHEGA